MDDLVAWLEQQLAEDEQAARIIANGGYEPVIWYAEDARPGQQWVAIHRRERTSTDPPGVYEDSGEAGEVPVAIVANSRCEHLHIVRWDPARVLAEVRSKREIVGLHGPFRLAQDQTVGCATCSYRDDQDELCVQFPCATLRTLAQPYAGRPGWRAEWAVEVTA